MIIFLGILFFLVGFFMLCLILLQEGKGGGLAAMGGAATDSVMGASNPLRRWTTYFFIAFVVLALAINYTYKRSRQATFVAPIETMADDIVESTSEAQVPEEEESDLDLDDIVPALPTEETPPADAPTDADDTEDSVEGDAAATGDGTRDGAADEVDDATDDAPTTTDAPEEAPLVPEPVGAEGSEGETPEAAADAVAPPAAE